MDSVIFLLPAACCLLLAYTGLMACALTPVPSPGVNSEPGSSDLTLTLCSTGMTSQQQASARLAGFLLI
jgi:hypothetical protein